MKQMKEMNTISKKRIVSIWLIIMLIAASFVIMTGCGATTLEDYCKKHPDELSEMQEYVDTINSSINYGKMSVDIKNNQIIYTVKMNKTYTSEQVSAMKSSLETTLKSSASQFEDIIDGVEKDTDIKDITMSIQCQNGDGTEIFSQDYE